MPDQDPYLLLSFDGACFIPSTACFNRSVLQQDNKMPMKTSSLSPRDRIDPSILVGHSIANVSR